MKKGWIWKQESSIISKKLRELIGGAVRSLKMDICIFADTAAIPGFSPEEAAKEAAFGTGYSQYDFVKIGKVPKKLPEISFLSEKEIHDICQDALMEAACVNHARDLGNTPSNIMTPEALAEEAGKIAEELDLDCEILTNKELEEIGAGAILGVNRGSSHGARLITVKYEGAPGEDYTALVGKGLTFDAGGYNIKTGTHMDGMKFDMCGAANVLCTLELIARRKAKVNVMAVIGATENKIGPDGYTCNDVLTSLSGKTIEITNTDAEGRLVLCDAITWAQRKGAKKIIDMATLTGACVAALGKNYTGAFTNSQSFLKELEKHSQKTEEKLWQLPVDEDFHKQVRESNVRSRQLSGRRLPGRIHRRRRRMDPSGYRRKQRLLRRKTLYGKRRYRSPCTDSGGNVPLIKQTESAANAALSVSCILKSQPFTAPAKIAFCTCLLNNMYINSTGNVATTIPAPIGPHSV